MRKNFSRAALLLMLAAVIATAFLMRGRINPAAIETWIDDLGVWGSIAFVTAFAFGTVGFLPGALFGLAGGMLFGPLWGTMLNLLGATVGASLAFLTARYLASDWVKRRTQGPLKKIVQGVEKEGWRFVAMTRLVPLVPFNLLNYALGLTQIPFTVYILTTALCMLPGTLAYTWLGHAGRGALTGDEKAIQYALLGLGALAVIAFLPHLIARIHAGDMEATHWLEPEALATALHEKPDLIVVDVRSPQEFSGPTGHIQGARNIPVEQIVASPSHPGLPREHPIVIVCLTDKRSEKAAKALRAAGLDQIFVLRGGMQKWNAEHRPVEQATVQA